MERKGNRSMEDLYWRLMVDSGDREEAGIKILEVVAVKIGLNPRNTEERK